MEVIAKVKEEVQVEFECTWNYHEVKEEDGVLKTEEEQKLEIDPDEEEEEVKPALAIYLHSYDDNGNDAEREHFSHEEVRKEGDIFVDEENQTTELIDAEDHQVGMVEEVQILFNGIQETNSNFVAQKDKNMDLVRRNSHTRSKSNASCTQGNTSSPMNPHTEEKIYYCGECNKMRKVDLVRNSLEKPFDCAVCTKYFIETCNLNVHIQKPTGEEANHGVCKVGWNNKQHLKTCRQKYSDERPFLCEECKKSFTRECQLITHMQMHADERLFHCGECKRVYTDKYNLIIHMRRHTGEKPFCCALCKKGFIRKDGLMVHMRSHTGEKPYHCVQCKKSFARKFLLNAHMRAHT